MILKKLAVALFALFSVYSTSLAQEEAEGAFLKGDIVYGTASAPVEVIEYGSMTCPHCGHFAQHVFPHLKKDYIETGKVRFVFRNFVRDRYDMAVALISRCTDDAAVTKKLLDAYFLRQEEWVRANNPYEVIADIAKGAGLTQPEMSRCISDQEAQQHLVEMTQNGAKTYQIKGIPYILVNGKFLEGHSYEAVKAAIDAAL